VGELIFIFCTFIELMRCHVRIGCRKKEVLHYDLTVGALISKIDDFHVVKGCPFINRLGQPSLFQR
jgi:hypothetical protein